MPGFYRKKRRKAGPSKNDEKVRRAQAAEESERAAGTLSTRFPAVRALRVALVISTPQQAVLESSEKTYGPQDPFLIEADCPGSCGSGGFDFSETVAEALQAGRSAGEVSLACAEPSYSGGPNDACGCVAVCRFSL